LHTTRDADSSVYVPQEVYPCGGEYCDGGGDIKVYAGDSEDGDEASTALAPRLPAVRALAVFVPAAVAGTYCSRHPAGNASRHGL
jgi:hypothetical protein